MTGVDNSGKKVVVGLTGRVGSSVAAFLLKKQGFNVIGMSIVTNIGENFGSDNFFPKCHVEDLDKIKDFCNSLKIPFYATDAKSQFECEVIDPLLANKLVGNANSSCFNCTQMRIKIMYAKMKKLKADFIATGHFCKVHKNLNSEEYFIHSNNHESDQAHLLSDVDSRYLKHLILPLGELRADEIEKIALRFNLNIPSKSMNKNFCFQEQQSYKHFVKQKVPKSLIREGQILNKDTENYHGDHEGMIDHYITENELDFKGIPQGDTEIEVVGYNYEKSLIYVGTKHHLTYKGVQLTNLKISKSLDKIKPIHCYVKNKYSHIMVKCQLYFKNNNSAYIEFEAPIYPVINGEVFILFDRNTRNAKIIGHGMVSERGEFNIIDRVDEFRSKSDKNNPENQIFKF